MKLSAVYIKLLLFLTSAVRTAPVDNESNEIVTSTVPVDSNAVEVATEPFPWQRDGRIVGGSEVNSTGLCRNMPGNVGCMIAKEASAIRDKQCASYSQGRNYMLVKGEKSKVPYECQLPFCRSLKIKKFSDGKKRVFYKDCSPGPSLIALFYRPAQEVVCRRLREEGRHDEECAGIGESNDDDGPVSPPRGRPSSSSEKGDETAQRTGDEDESVFPPRRRPSSSSKKGDKTVQRTGDESEPVLPPRTRPSSRKNRQNPPASSAQEPSKSTPSSIPAAVEN
ncbi:hypothetical protein GQ602_006170 [Ophiocordyceps camponoti-floridani]|uniref:Secreted protein n=1 Tax=Ophiocordyceps camponoti-floridani TaxID=2030778 RepID=A0A8H4Q2T9_9HYPO|nr:hypothetical protein GQ602_006170 [Ophiocordyceps camponoti-floridani]